METRRQVGKSNLSKVNGGNCALSHSVVWPHGLQPARFLSATLWTVAHQASLYKEFSRQEYWSGSHSLLQGIFPTQGSNLHLLGSLLLPPAGKPLEATCTQLGNRGWVWVHLKRFLEEKDFSLGNATGCRKQTTTLIKIIGKDQTDAN